MREGAHRLVRSFFIEEGGRTQCVYNDPPVQTKFKKIIMNQIIPY